MRVALDAGDVVVRRRFRIAGEEVAGEIHSFDVMLHAKIAHAEEVNALRGIGDIGIELFKERIRIQCRREASSARALKWRISSLCRHAHEWRKRSESEEMAAVDHGMSFVWDLADVKLGAMTRREV